MSTPTAETAAVMHATTSSSTPASLTSSHTENFVRYVSALLSSPLTTDRTRRHQWFVLFQEAKVRMYRVIVKMEESSTINRHGAGSRGLMAAFYTDMTFFSPYMCASLDMSPCYVDIIVTFINMFQFIALLESRVHSSDIYNENHESVFVHLLLHLLQVYATQLQVVDNQVDNVYYHHDCRRSNQEGRHPCATLEWTQLRYEASMRLFTVLHRRLHRLWVVLENVETIETTSIESEETDTSDVSDTDEDSDTESEII